MSYHTTVSGQVNLVDDSTGSTFLSLVLQNLFTSITNIVKLTQSELALTTSSGATTLNLSGITTPQMIVIWFKSGTTGDTISVKHDGNSAGAILQVGSSMIIQGSIGASSGITVTATSTNGVIVQYLVV